MNKTTRGFSLVETLMAIMIMAILAGLAIPHYQRYLIDTHRSEGSLALENLALNLNHYYNTYQTYQDVSLKKLHLSALTPNSYYRLSIDRANQDSFSISASPLGGQYYDTQCGTLILDSVGKRNATGSSSNPAQDCW